MSGYCAIAPGHPFHGPYHEREHGFPTTDEAVLFERLMLEVNQAGLSWLVVLRKRDAFNAAFLGFDVDKVAALGPEDVERLMQDAGIVRNRLKIEAAIHNARVIQGLRASHGGFAAWIAAHHPLTKVEWVKLFRRTFRFTGGEIVGEFLMSIGYLPLAHAEDCPVDRELAALGQPWRKAVADGFVY
ncbi:DNA-3-methyladenine glycosylase I [Nitrospirillum amazonense]|uniref:DNA-3-methyladenine glycosylase I n=1 Tax=Nitrospirillum amazonense TaxID=28077 RepID=UPI002DD435A7|nr:DNA-3-methyladenine glycosylase I [Nitrospirillum amazonense]MEC4589574.1 DNA-3-methyladenine glycosylase I [Nitrospirillum amazonense]